MRRPEAGPRRALFRLRHRTRGKEAAISDQPQGDLAPISELRRINRSKSGLLGLRSPDGPGSRPAVRSDDQAVYGRLIAGLGIFFGFLSVWVRVIFSPDVEHTPGESWTASGWVAYYSHWINAAFILVMLGAALLYLFVGREEVTELLGAILFGFLFTVPYCAVVGNAGKFGAGAWLGLGTLAIPLGAHLARPLEERGRFKIGRPTRAALVLVMSGIAVCLLVPPALALVGYQSRAFWYMPGSARAIMLLIAVLCFLIGLFALAMAVATERALRFASAARCLAAFLFGIGLSLVFFNVWHAATAVIALPAGGPVEAFGGAMVFAATLELCHAAEVAHSSEREAYEDVIAEHAVAARPPSAGEINKGRLES